MAAYTPATIITMRSLGTGGGTSVLTGAGGTTYIIRTIHVDTSAASKTFTMSIGADAAGTRLFDAYALTANVPSIFNGWWTIAGSGAHDVDANCSATTVTLFAGGVTYA